MFASRLDSSCCAGPSAVLAALVASGIACDTFQFVGFLHAKQGQRQKQLKQLAGGWPLLHAYSASTQVVTASPCVSLTQNNKRRFTDPSLTRQSLQSGHLLLRHVPSQQVSHTGVPEIIQACRRVHCRDVLAPLRPKRGRCSRWLSNTDILRPSTRAGGCACGHGERPWTRTPVCLSPGAH